MRFSYKEFKQRIEPLISRGHSSSRKYPLFCIFLLATTLFTWIIGLQDNRYIALNHENYGEVFPAQRADWTREGGSRLIGSDNAVIEVYPESGRGSGATFVVPLPDSLSAEYNLIRVRTITRTLGRVSNSSLKTDAGVLLRILDKDDNIIQYSWVSRLTGEFNTHRDEYLTSFEPEAAAIRIRFSNRQSDGSFALERVHVDLVKTSPTYQYVLLPLMLLLWAIVFWMTIVYVTARLGRYRMLLFAGAILLMIIGILLPTGLRDTVVVPLFNELRALGLAGGGIAMVHFYKAGHFLAFFVVSLILFYNARRLQISKIDLFAIMSVLAIATEGAQLHLFFRSTQLLDIVIDVAGILLALLVCRLTHKPTSKGISRKKRRSKRRSSKSRASGSA